MPESWQTNYCDPPFWAKPLVVLGSLGYATVDSKDVPDNAILATLNKHDNAIRLAESCLAFMYSVRNARSKRCIFVASCTLYSSITQKSATVSMLRLLRQISEELSSDLPFWQSGTSWIDVCDSLHGNMHRVKNSSLGNRIVKVFNHVLAHAFYAKLGIEIDHKLFKRFEEKKMRPTVWECASFADSLVGLFLFLAKAGRQAMATGSIECFFVDEVVVARWLDKAGELRKDAEFISNPSSIGISLAVYIGKLDEAIETGEQLTKIFKTGMQHSVIYSVLLELKLVKKRHQASLLAASFRRAPIGIFLYGTAGVAKSFLAAGIFNHYCSVRGIAKEEAYCWTRDDNDPFYSGYKSHFAGVLYDDAAKFRSNKVQGVDPSIKDIISAINNIPFITNQAELADKGKVPFMAEWVGVTSNLEDLNADQYYNSSAAFLRRLPYRITPFVKPAFRVEGEDKIDPTKMPAGVQYPDLWTFDVHKAVVNGQKGEYIKVNHFESYSELLSFLTPVYEQHIANQDKLMATVAKIGPEALCACKLPLSICQCKPGLFGPLVFGDVEAEVVAQASTVVVPDARARYDRLVEWVHLREALSNELCACPSERLYFRQLCEEPQVTRLLQEGANLDPKVLLESEQFIREAMLSFTTMTPRQRLDVLGDADFTGIGEVCEDEYLDFVPRTDKPCFYMVEQLAELKKTIMQFIPDILTDAELALLDAFLYNKAPELVARGCPISDIIKAADCYIKFYRYRLEDPAQLQAREMLLEGGNAKVRSIGLWFARQYFERKWVHDAVNYVATFGVTKWTVKKVVQKYSRDSMRTSVLVAGAQHDAKLGGRSKFVLVLLGVCASGAMLVLLYKTVKDFFEIPEKSQECIDHFNERRMCKRTNLPVEYCDSCVDTNYHAVEVQMDLNSVGHKPVPREVEKKNVWMVPERAITKLDVDPRRPQNISQAVESVKKNILYSQARFRVGDKMGTATSRIIAVNDRRFIANNHYINTPCQITIWFGPRVREGAQPSVVFDVTEDMVERHPKRDIAFVNTRALPTLFKDIRHVFPRESYQSIGAAYYVQKNEDNTLQKMECYGLQKVKLTGMQGNPDVDIFAWASRPMRPTDYGDCGSLLVVDSPIGCVIVGMHCGYSHMTGTAFATPLFQGDFECVQTPTVGLLEPYGTVAQVRTTFVDLLPTDKLFTDFHESGHIMTHGQLKGFRPRAKFSGQNTPFHEHIMSRAGQFDPPITDRLAAPVAHPWKQPQLVLKNYLSPTHSIKETVFRACAQAYEDHVSEQLTPDDWADIHPVPMSVAVNGFPGVANIDAQKFTTSGGHGFRGPKLQFMTEAQEFEEWTHFRSYKDCVVKEVDRILENACLGVRPHAVYTASMKDEMLSRAKVEAGKARSIYMCPVDFLTAMRMLTMGLTRVMVRRRDLFGIAVGLNTHSEEWDDTFNLANRIAGNNWIAGDFQSFEAILCLLISNYASDIFVGLARRSGMFSKGLLMALATLLADTVNPTIDFFGELITLLGGEVSGHQLTTFFNCVCNQLLHMYAFVVISGAVDSYEEAYTAAQKFFQLVYRNTLGDDVYLKVHEDCPWYNHTSIQKAFSDIGITYTMADKLAESRPYISWEEVSFLKRKFKDHECFPGMKVAALDKESIYKMLMYTIPSKSATQEEQLASAAASAQAEAFFHGREFFDQIDELIESLPKSEELEFRMTALKRPTWGQMFKRFVKASPKLRAKLMVPGDDAETMQTEGSYCQPIDVVQQTGWRVDPWGSTTLECSSEERFDAGIWLSPNTARKPRRNEKTPPADRDLLSKQSHKNQTLPYGHLEMTQSDTKKVISKLNNKERRKQKRVRWETKVVAQSEVTMDATSIAPVMAESVDVVQETTVFKNEPAAVSVDISASRNRLAAKMDMSQDLGSYLARPKLISTYTWAENGANGLKSTFQPWALFFNDANMAAKLKGYSLLRANLCLKFLVNGSPFYYGSMLAAYTPLSGWRADTAAGPTNVGLVANSQKPHVWLENQNMSTAEMTLPFVFPYPYIDIRLLSNLQSMGDVQLWQFAPLLSANGSASSNIDIQVYAWATDVMLSGPTDLPVMQSSFRHDGQVSGPASAVAAAAGKLSSVPVIAEYARATQMAASAVASVSSFFGFTNVPNVSDVAPMKQMPFQLASTEISEPVAKLSLQAKQETAVGSLQHGGLAEDELVIERFAGRSSFLVGSQWDTTLTPGTVLFTTMVNPAAFQSSGSVIAHTPVSYIANHFQYWRGSLRYTFKLVRSPYHRGRLQVSWDRAATNLSQGPTVGNPNTYTTIMDLDDESECSFVVPYMQPSQFLDCTNVFDVGTVNWSTSASPSGSFTGCNGVLSVRVVNRLTAPEASSSATLLVFVSGEPDLEFAAPKEFNTYNGTGILGLSGLTTSVAQSKVVYDDGHDAHTFAPPADNGDVYAEVFGEKVTSMREYMHRSSMSCMVQSSQPTSGVGLALNVTPIKRIPLPPGVYNNAWYTGTTSSGAGQLVNWSRFHPILSIGACFVGYKGSVNVTANVDQPRDCPIVDTLSIARFQNASQLGSTARRPNSTILSGAASSFNVNASFAMSQTLSGRTGQALTNTKTNTGLAAQLPYYSKSAFQLMNPFNEYSNQDTLTDANNDWWRLDWRYNKPGTTTSDTGATLTVYYATGPDFDLIFFVNVPLLTVVAVTPA